MPASPPAALLSPRARRGGGLVAAGLMAGVCMLVVAPPFLGEPVQAGLMQAFHAVCHQLPDRSFHVGGVALAVCHRCTGIYAGLLLGALLFPLVARHDAVLWPHSRTALFASLVPMAVDWTGDVLGVFTNTPTTRVATGFVFGVVAAYLLAHGLAGLFVPRAARVSPASS